MLAVSAVAVQAEDGGAGSAASDRARLEARLERLVADVEDTEARTAVLDDALLDLAGDDAKLRSDYDEASRRLSALERGMVADEAELSDLATKRVELQESLLAQEARIGAVLAAIQRMGRRPPPTLVAGEEALDTLRGAIALNAALPVLSDASAALSRDLAEADRLASLERDKWTRVRNNVTELVAERARLASLREELERRRALSVYERDQAAAALARLSEEAASVRDLLNALDRGQVRTAPPAAGFATRRGNLTFPVAGRLVGEYGDALPAGGLSEGLSLAALPGSTVFAPTPGTVLFSEPFRSYGNVLILDAGDGYHMVLVGLNEVFIGAGGAVDTGAPLGRMGRWAPRASAAVAGTSTSEDDSGGRSQRPTLYVELRKDGKAFDSHGWWREAPRQLGRTVE